jgi:hypothetical protein
MIKVAISSSILLFFSATSDLLDSNPRCFFFFFHHLQFIVSKFVQIIELTKRKSLIKTIQSFTFFIGQKSELKILSLQIPSFQRIQARNCMLAFF